MRLRSFRFTGLLMVSAAIVFGQSGQSLTGTVSDSMCGAQHMMKDASPAKCTRECVKSGSDYALISGGKVYTLKGNSTQLDKFAGQSVTVTGKVSGTTVADGRQRRDPLHHVVLCLADDLSEIGSAVSLRYVRAGFLPEFFDG